MGLSMKAAGASSYVAPSSVTGRVWSGQQESIFDWFARGTGNLVVRARAGSGKTTTIIEGVSRAPESSILLAAFNKRIADHMGERIAATGSQAAVKTLHALGYGIIRGYWPKAKMNDERGQQLAWKAGGKAMPHGIARKVKRLASIAKGSLPDFDPADPAFADILADIAIRFDLEPEEDDAGWTTDRIAETAVKAMQLATIEDGTGFDFDDMLFLPVFHGWIRPRYGLVVIDEAQDMNAVQIELARKVLVYGGRFAAVGDDRQAIYGFRGADSTAIDRLKREMNAAELGLTVTYRCGKVIVDHARMIVPDIVAAPQNPVGSIQYASVGDVVDCADIGDFILSRRNAPLVPICLSLIRSGKRARIEGREIGHTLASIAKRWKPISIPHIENCIEKWRQRENSKLDFRNTEEAMAKKDTINDQAETLLALLSGLKDASDLVPRIVSIFGDGADDNRPAVMCSSIHKAKGMESKRVFVLKAHLNKITRKSNDLHQQANRELEEANLEYVAATRAIETLVWVE